MRTVFIHVLAVFLFLTGWSLVWADAFSLVALPDTQNYSTSYPEIFMNQTQWIVDHRATENIAFVTHLGDLVNTASSSEEWTRADAAMDTLHGQVPYSACMGNHDIGSNYDAYFGSSRYAGQTGYGGSSANQRNHYQTFSAGGYEFLHLNLQYAPDTAAISWAQSIINANPGKPTIVSTHDNLNLTGRSTNGQNLWDGLVKSSDQVFMVLNGHWHGEFQQLSLNDSNDKVIEMLSDYQSYSNGGDGYLRRIEFDVPNNRINVQTYSTTKGTYLTDSDSQFSYDVTFGTKIQVNGLIEPPPSSPPAYTITLQDGMSGYAGTQDTELKYADQTTGQGGSTVINVDASDGTPSGPTQGLFRFDGLVGDTPGKIRPGMKVTAATLTLDVTDAGSGLNVHQMNVGWDEAATWSSMSQGIQTDGIEAAAGPETSIGANDGNANVGTGTVGLNVTASVKNWQEGSANHGWALMPHLPNGTNGLRFHASEIDTANLRPKLQVTVEMDPSLKESVFQQGRNGYAGAYDTELRQSDPDSNLGGATSLSIDADDPSGTGGDTQNLIRFDDLFGTDAGQIPTESNIAFARLILNATDAGSGFTVHRMLRPWQDTDTWNGLGNGVQPDGIEAAANAELTVGANDSNNTNVPTGLIQLDVTDTLRAWLAGETNFGWAFLPYLAGTDGIDYYSSDYSTRDLRPMLVVNYAIPEPVTLLLLITGLGVWARRSV